jgi:hypothetical protein
MLTENTTTAALPRRVFRKLYVAIMGRQTEELPLQEPLLTAMRPEGRGLRFAPEGRDIRVQKCVRVCQAVYLILYRQFHRLMKRHGGFSWREIKRGS